MNNSTFLGVCKKVITPNIGASLVGYNPYTKADFIHDDIHVTVFVFCEGDTKLVMISAEILCINSQLDSEIRAKIAELLHIEPHVILLSAIHTHNGPNLQGMEGWGNVDEVYYREIFLPGILACAVEANAKLVKVKMGVASGESDVGVNRRETDDNFNIVLGQNPWGCFLKMMTVISFVDDSGKPVANMIHYGCHATSLGCSGFVSRDWPGIMIDAMEAMVGGVTAFFAGFAGDVGPRLINGRTVSSSKATPEERLMIYREVGNRAARDALAIHGRIKTYGDFSIATVAAYVNLPLEKRITLEEAEAGFRQIPADAVNHKGLERKYYEKVIASYKEGYEERETRNFLQVSHRIGDVVFAGFPFEVFSQIGLLIQKFSVHPYTLPLAPTNGYLTYFPCEEDICRGGYEIEVARKRFVQAYDVRADKSMIRQTVENLNKLKY